MINLYRKAITFFYPPKCVFCEKIVKNYMFSVCEKCLDNIPYNTSCCKKCATPLYNPYGDGLCLKCKSKKQGFDKVFAPLIYKDSVRESILRFKFSGRKAYARTYAGLIFMKIKEEGYRPDAITFVPIHFLRLGMRGYNQAENLAEYLAEIMNVDLINTLKKIKNTKPLSKQKHKNRENLVRGVFKIRNNASNYIQGKNILLIDDIFTTGATVNECIKLLKKAGAENISVATIAVTPKI